MYNYGALALTTNLLDELMNIEPAIGFKGDTSYHPQVNILREKDSDTKYRIDVSLPGINIDDIDITSDRKTLMISRSKKEETLSDIVYLKRGISRIDEFSLRFNLSDGVEVVSAKSENGILSISLEHKIPDEKKPKRIAIERK